jgi:hypothetical protein
MEIHEYVHLDYQYISTVKGGFLWTKEEKLPGYVSWKQKRNLYSILCRKGEIYNITHTHTHTGTNTCRTKHRNYKLDTNGVRRNTGPKAESNRHLILPWRANLSQWSDTPYPWFLLWISSHTALCHGRTTEYCSHALGGRFLGRTGRHRMGIFKTWDVGKQSRACRWGWIGMQQDEFICWSPWTQPRCRQGWPPPSPESMMPWLLRKLTDFCFWIIFPAKQNWGSLEERNKTWLESEEELQEWWGQMDRTWSRQRAPAGQV